MAYLKTFILRTEKTKLQGKGVLITRPFAQAQVLADEARKYGLHPFVYPTVAVQYSSYDMLLPKLQNIGAKNIIVFVSVHSVRSIFKHVDLQDLLANNTFAVVGASTKQCLESYGVKAKIYPDINQQHSEGLLQHKLLHQLKGQHVYIVRAQSGRTLLAETFIKRGATVHYIEAYQRTIPDDFDQPTLLRAFQQEKVHVILLTSYATYQNLVQLMGASIETWLTRCKLVVPSVRIKNLICAKQTCDVYVASNASDEQMLKTAARIFD